jgi:integrase
VVEEKAAKRIERENLGRTVETVGNAYFTAAQKGRHKPKGRPRAASTTRVDRGYFDRVALPAIGEVPIVEVTRELVQDHVDRLADTATVSAARGFLKVVRQILAFAEYRGLVTGNVCRFVEASDYDGRDRVLSDDELRAIWDAADMSNALGFGQAYAIVIRLCMVTGQRRAEVAEATLSEFDLEQRTWLIPSERRKTNRAHMVPLSDMAVDLIRDALALRRNSNSAFLFPSPRSVSDAPVSSDVASRCFAALAEYAGVENARLHDLRRSCATCLTSERIGVPRHTVSQVLGHHDSAGGAAATSVYDRHSYLPQKRQALDAWAALLAEIVSGTPRPENVVPLVRA